MKTVPFSDILGQVCQLIGLDRPSLNDKSFGTIRDFCGRRISSIWDREEWPDSERRINTFTGNPIKSIDFISRVLITENSDPIITEITNEQIVTDPQGGNSMLIRLNLDIDFQRIYLIDFTDNAYKRDAIEQTYVSFNNPFYILKDDGTRVPITDKNYTFNYTTLEGERGPFINTIEILSLVPGTVEYPYTYKGPNSDFTTKVVFNSNLNLLVQLESDALQGLEAFSGDHRNSTRFKNESFLVEDFNDRNDTGFEGGIIQEEYSYLRFLTNGRKHIKYRTTCPRFTGVKYDPYLQYSTGSIVYYDTGQASSAYNPTQKQLPSRGNFFIARQTVPVAGAHAPAEDSQFWKMISIPYRFKDYLINGISADFMRSEGRAEEANMLDGSAEMALQQQIDVLIRQQGQVQRMNMVYTY